MVSASRLYRASITEEQCPVLRVTQSSVFPVLDNPVYVVSKRDLEIIFDHRRPSRAAVEEDAAPGYCVEVGESAIFDGFDIRIDPDVFFGKHAAVLGSTGSGKSCTIASIIQAVLALPSVKRSHIIILDTNGEYRAAFKEDSTGNTSKARCLYIPTEGAAALTMPPRVAI